MEQVVYYKQNWVWLWLVSRIIVEEKIIGQLGTESGGLSEETSRIREELQADLGLVVSVAVKPESTVDNVLAKVYLALASTSGYYQKEVDLGGYSWQYLRQLACLQALILYWNTLWNSRYLL